MKNALVAQGVPENKIFLDYAGFRTFDSVIRMNKIFGQTDFTIISQRFHNERAVYIANRLGLNAVAFNAQDVSAYSGFKTKQLGKETLKVSDLLFAGYNFYSSSFNFARAIIDSPASI